MTESTLPLTWSDDALSARAFALATALKLQGLRMATAESCSGGWIAKLCTDLAGSSVWFECGWITYSNRAKTQQLGVQPGTLARFGAVSEAVAAEMAAGAQHHANADLALSVTGVAGPSGGSPDKPVGTVCFAWVGSDQQPETETQWYSIDAEGERAREWIRRATAAHAMDGLLARMHA
ncbi:MAG: CinA family protein [Pseudomonadota bacterium]